MCVSPSPYYIYWFEKYYPNVTLNRDEGPFCLQCMNRIQGVKPSGKQWNRLLDAVVSNLKYKKIKIDNAIYIKVFSDVTVSYITFSTDDVINTTTNETAFTELRIFFEEYFEIKVQEGYALKYLYLRIFQSLLGFSVNQTDHILELVN